MSPKTLFDLFKNIAKVIILGIVGYMVYSSHFEDILMLAAIDNHFAILIQFGSLMLDFIIKAGIAFLIIAAADYGVTKWKFLKDQKMSFKEKYEYEQLETEIDSMEKELKQLEDEMCSGNLTVSQLNEKGFKIMQLRDLIETKTMRWMELSELVN